MLDACITCWKSEQCVEYFRNMSDEWLISQDFGWDHFGPIWVDIKLKYSSLVMKVIELEVGPNKAH